MWMWNHNDIEKMQFLDKHLRQLHIDHHKSHIDWAGIEPAPSTYRDSRWNVTSEKPLLQLFILSESGNVFGKENILHLFWWLF